MCNTNHDPNKGKEKLNEESVTNQNNENKRKVIVMEEKPDEESQNSKSVKNDIAGEEESTNSSKEISPFLLFGFIIDPTKGSRKAYSCNFCSQKFVSPQALGGHQNCHKLERNLKKKNETMNKAWEIFSNAAESSSFNAWNLHHISHADQEIVNQQVTMTEIDFGLVSEGGAGGDADLEHTETQEEEASKNIDLSLKL